MQTLLVITLLYINDGVIYTIIVEARSEHLSGESEPMIFTPGKSI